MVKTATQIEQIKQMAKSLRLTLISEDLEMMLHEADEAKMSHREFLMHIFSLELKRRSIHRIKMGVMAPLIFQCKGHWRVLIFLCSPVSSRPRYAIWLNAIG